MSTLDTLVEEVQEMEKKKKAMSKSAVPVIKAELKAFLEANPEVEAIRWNQYVPGFNDGEPCTFSLGDIQMRLVPEEEEEVEEESSEGEEESEEEEEYEDEDYDDDEEDWIDEYGLDDVSKKLASAFKKLSGKLQSLEPILEEAFGSNAEITATRKKITVEDYDCGF